MNKMFKVFLCCLLFLSFIHAETLMLLHNSDGTVDSISVSDINKITFNTGEVSSGYHKISMKNFKKLSANIAVAKGIATVEFKLNSPQKVIVDLINVRGRLVRSIDKGSLETGSHKFSFNTDNLTSGNYIMRIKTLNKTLSKKLLIVN